MRQGIWRALHTQLLQVIKGGGAFSTMHMLLAYLQMAPLEQCPVVASLLLQLDLLAEPCKMSMYREEAIETLIEGLKAKEILISQINSAKTIVALAGRFSLSGKPLTEAWLLRTAGFNKHYNAFMKAEKLLNSEGESPEFLDEEEAAKDWDRRVVSVLVNFEFGAVFEALGECLKNNSVELARPCLVAATWLTHMLKVLPDTGVRDVARQCLLESFVMILQSSRNLEERILATLALTSFINDSEGRKDLGAYVKGICEPLRQLRKFSSAAADILRSLLSLPFVNISKLCSFAELAQLDSSMNGEVRSLAHFGDRIYSGHSDGTLKVWDGRKMLLHLIQEVQEHTKPIISISISKPGEMLYTGSVDKTVRVWAVGREEIHCIQVHDMKDPIEALYFNGDIACSVTQGTGVKIHNWNGSSKLAIPNKNVKCLTMAEGKIYCGCADYSIQEIDLNCGTVRTLDSGVRKLFGKNSIYAIQIHDNHLYAGGSVVDGVAAKVWNLSTNTLMGSLSMQAEVRCIAVNNDFIFLGSKSGIIEVWSRERLARRGSLNAGGGGNNRVTCLAVDKDGEVLFSGSQDGRIQAWSLT